MEFTIHRNGRRKNPPDDCTQDFEELFYGGQNVTKSRLILIYLICINLAILVSVLLC